MRTIFVILGGVLIAGALVGGTVLVKEQQRRVEDLQARQVKMMVRQKLEVQAASAFARENWTTALALYQELAGQVGGDKDLLKTVVMRVQICKDKLGVGATGGAATQGGVALGGNPVGDLVASEVVGADRRVHEAPKEGEVRVMRIKELGNFKFDAEKDTKVPADVQAMDGMKVRLRGFMLPIQQAERVTEFALVPSLFACCFGQPPGVEHTITVRCPKDKAITYVVDEVDVEGVLRVNVKREEGYTYSIFELECSSVRLAK